MACGPHIFPSSLISESLRSARAVDKRHQPSHDFGALAGDVGRFTNVLLQIK